MGELARVTCLGEILQSDLELRSLLLLCLRNLAPKWPGIVSPHDSKEQGAREHPSTDKHGSHVRKGARMAVITLVRAQTAGGVARFHSQNRGGDKRD